MKIENKRQNRKEERKQLMHIIFSQNALGKTIKEKMQFRYAEISKIQNDKEEMDKIYHQIKYLVTSKSIEKKIVHQEVKAIIENMFLEIIPTVYIEEFVEKVSEHSTLNYFFDNYRQYGQQGFHMIGLSLLKC